MSEIKTTVSPATNVRIESTVKGARLQDVKPLPAHITEIEAQREAEKSRIAVFYADGRSDFFAGPTVGRTEPETRLLPNEDGLL